MSYLPCLEFMVVWNNCDYIQKKNRRWSYHWWVSCLYWDPTLLSPAYLSHSVSSSSCNSNALMFFVCAFSFVKLQHHDEECLYPTRDIWWQLYDCSIISKLWQSHHDQQLHSDTSRTKQWTWRHPGTKGANNEYWWHLQDINYRKRYAGWNDSPIPRNYYMCQTTHS